MSVEVAFAAETPKVVGVNQLPAPPLAVTAPHTTLPLAVVLSALEPLQDCTPVIAKVDDVALVNSELPVSVEEASMFERLEVKALDTVDDALAINPPESVSKPE